MFGRWRIHSKSGKTIEGMVGGWLAMSLVRLMLRPLPWHPVHLCIDGVTAVVEALNAANNNDNLVMPLVQFSLMAIIK